MKVVRYHTGHQFVVALAGDPGRRFIPIMYMNSARITVRKVPIAEQQYMTEMDYPIAKAIKRLKHAGRSFGITKSAKKFLDAAS